MLEFISNMKFYESDDGQGEGAGDNVEETKVEETKTSYKSFETEDEYNQAIKSERSKAKNEVLKSLGIDNLDEGKTQLTKASKLEEELRSTKVKTTELEEQLTLTKNGVKEDYAKEALELAKSKVNDEVDLSTALGEVIKKFPMMASETPTKSKPNVGGEKNNEKKDTDDQASIKENLKSKYPWLKL